MTKVALKMPQNCLPRVMSILRQFYMVSRYSSTLINLHRMQKHTIESRNWLRCDKTHNLPISTKLDLTYDVR